MLFDIKYIAGPERNPRYVCSIFADSKVEALAAFLETQGTLSDEELSKLEAEENKSW